MGARLLVEQFFLRRKVGFGLLVGAPVDGGHAADARHKPRSAQPCVVAADCVAQTPARPARHECPRQRRRRHK
eukprot:4565892-Pleurochrysis_carterae.AAC.1